MKRGIFLIVLAALIAAGALSVGGALPYMPVLNAGMEPDLPRGSLVFVEKVPVTDIAPGDIVFLKVPEQFREPYGYPAVTARRVTAIETGRETVLNTGGTSQSDPFAVGPGMVIGKAGAFLPGLGLPMMFVQTGQDLLLVSGAMVLLALFLYRTELGRYASRFSRRRLYTGDAYTAPDKDSTGAALEKFAAAMEEYAMHLSSHTSAIKGLSEASQELKRGAAEQNRILARMLETAEATARPSTLPAFLNKPGKSGKKGGTVAVSAVNNRILDSLLRNIRDLREANASAPSIPEVSFSEGKGAVAGAIPLATDPAAAGRAGTAQAGERRLSYRDLHPHA